MVKNALRKIYGHARDFWSDLGFAKNEEVTISGLAPEEKAFKQSINDECVKALKKFRRDLPDCQRIAIHVKSSNKGKGKMYELKASLYLPGQVLHASANDRELYSCLSIAFKELLTSARHLNSLKKNKHVDRE